MCQQGGDKVKKVYCDVTHITNQEVDDGFKLQLYFESGKTAALNGASAGWR